MIIHFATGSTQTACGQPWSASYTTAIDVKVTCPKCLSVLAKAAGNRHMLNPNPFEFSIPFPFKTCLTVNIALDPADLFWSFDSKSKVRHYDLIKFGWFKSAESVGLQLVIGPLFALWHWPPKNKG